MKEIVTFVYVILYYHDPDQTENSLLSNLICAAVFIQTCCMLFSGVFFSSNPVFLFKYFRSVIEMISEEFIIWLQETWNIESMYNFLMVLLCYFWSLNV